MAALLLAAAALTIGASVYLLDRDVPVFRAIEHPSYAVFGTVGENLPTAAHAFAFTVLTWLAAGGSRSVRVPSALLWLLIEVAFEVLQHDMIGTSVLALLEGLHGPGLAAARAFVASGVFDPLDVAAATVGNAASFGVMSLAGNRGRS